MGCEWIKAAEGHKYEATELGEQIGRVAVKLTGSYPYKTRDYLHCVPKSWITQGWVRLVVE